MKNHYLEYLNSVQSNCPTLAKFSRNLNMLALENKLNPTYNREREVSEVRTVLLRRTKPNPLLLGVAGCGKTAIVEEIARTLVTEYLESDGFNYPPVIYELSLNALISGCKYRGDFEERMEKLFEELHNRNIILFIDEIHCICDAGGAEGAISAGQSLKPALARGDIHVIGATTIDEYEKYIATDKALARRFSRINVAPLAGTARTNCITRIIAEYGQYYCIDTKEVSTDTVQHIVDDIIPNTVFPDNIIDILDEALASAKYNGKRKITDEDVKKTASRQHSIFII